jgi:glycosyltransferase involved in cell wall biosynthesis
MKVVHINANRGDGAALCALRISQALKSKGVDTSFIVSNGVSTDVFTVALPDKSFWNRNRLLRCFKKLLLKLNIRDDEEQLRNELRIAGEKSNEHVYSHLPLTSFKNLSLHPLIKEADIVHLHWVSGFVDYPTFFKEVKKPIVWTLHDKYPAVGLLHYCSKFFPIPEALKPIDKKCRDIKRNAIKDLKNLHIVAISEQMMTICNQSDVLHGLPTTLIHNGVDTNIFSPIAKDKARKELGLPINGEDGNYCTIFMVCGFDLFGKNKGLLRVVKALEGVKASNKMLVCVGLVPNPQPIIQTSFPVRFFGRVVDTNMLSTIYSAIDFFIQASYEETFAQTPLEAMSCGKPVISTPCSGSTEIIHSYNGVLCEGYEPENLRKGIQKAVDKNLVTPYSSKEIREEIQKEFSYENIAEQYLLLYKEVLK